MLSITDIRADFPILERKVHGKDLVYLDNAATTLKPKEVTDVVERYYHSECANIHRGIHLLSEEATEHYEAAREKIKGFINASSLEEIVFTSGTTDSINLVVQSYGRKNLQAGDEVIISGMEHHSNIVPWQMLRDEKNIVLKVIPVKADGTLDMNEFHAMLSEKTKFISVMYVSNVLGTINPIQEICDAGKERDIPVLVDAAQAIAHLPVDVQKLDCAFLAFSGHKMYGPTGVGVLYGKKDLLNEMPPVKGGGDMILSVSFEKTVYNELPYKFEAGTPNIAGVTAMGAAVDYLNKLGWPLIEEREELLMKYAKEQISAIEGVRIIGQAESGAVSFVMDDIHPHDIGTIVDRAGIAIRTGHHCAQPLMKTFGIAATARASFSIYNTTEEVDALVKALKKVQEIFA
jgi:cysteine desulfurase / selenocysteine lyase